MDKKGLLREIKEEVLNLKNSPLYKERVENNVFPVIGEGNHSARVMFIGEAPGANEAKNGKPFCGSAGKMLDWCLQEIEFDRADAYVTNIIKDRPPKNRDPYPEEIEIYAPFLDRQINIIQPKIIAPLGRFSAGYILEKFGLGDQVRPITSIHGAVFEAESDYGKITIIPLLHPASAIHNPHKKDTLLDGFKSLREKIDNTPE